MTIYANSRYANQPVKILPNADGTYSPTVFRSAVGLPPTFLHVEFRMGDRFDSLAYHYYGDSTLYWLIADANPEIFFPGGLVAPRTIIRIPIS